MVGLKVIGCAVGNVEFREETSGAAIAVGDAIKFSSGAIIPVTPGDPIEGIALEAATGAGTQVKYATGFRLRVIADNDNDGTTFAATHEGTYFDMIGATGAMQIDTSSTSTTGQFRCVKYNPQGYGQAYDSDTSIGIFEIAEMEGLSDYA